MGTISKLIHISVDLALFSGFLAGIRRNTGLTPKLDFLEKQTELKSLSDKYLNFGEWLLDASATSMSSSEYFARK